MKLDADQQRAVELMCQAPIGIITGRPGTGKTTITLEAIERLEAAGVSYALCAPTGKAARRMEETTHRAACTIHRLLGWRWDGWTYNANYRLPFDAIIVDESSMIDTLLMAALLEAVATDHTRIVFVGDANQLPPVGPGAPFRDMIDSGEVPTIWLNTLHRAAQGSWVCRNSAAILAGRGVEFDDFDDFEFHQLGSDQAWFIPTAIADIVRALTEDGVDPGEVQILTPMRKRDAGSTALNNFMQKEFNPSGPTIRIEKRGVAPINVRENDRVIQTHNDYKLEVFNGEVGYAAAISSRPPGLSVKYDTGNRVYTQATARNLELAYAITIHKSQGSEWPFVIVVCHSIHKFMLSRQLLYTAVTRAREAVFLVGDRAGVDHALRTVKDLQRRTLLKGRLEAA